MLTLSQPVGVVPEQAMGCGLKHSSALVVSGNSAVKGLWPEMRQDFVRITDFMVRAFYIGRNVDAAYPESRISRGLTDCSSRLMVFFFQPGDDILSDPQAFQKIEQVVFQVHI